ncbi:condensation domain-containing protein, partial [Actinacidiphila acidipaludis]
MVSDPHPAGRPGAARLPLSAAQRDIWLAHDADPTGRRYSIGEFREILGPVDAQLLADCWYRLVQESDALRISGTEADESGIRQIVDPDPGGRSLQQVDVTGADDPEAAARAWMDADIARPIDLARGPLTRHALIRLAGDRFFYYHRYHHLVMDGMGAALVVGRLGALYEQAVGGEPWDAGPFVPLADLLAEEEAYRSSEKAAEDRAYWSERLAGVPETPRLGEGRTPDHDPAVPFVRRTVVVDVETADRIRSTARAAYKVSWPVLVVALLAAYTHRAGGDPQELVIGLPVTGRTTPLARSTPAMMSNVVPLRIAAGRERTLAELVAGTAAEVRQALRHQLTRYEDMCRDLGLGESDRRISSPLVNIMAFGGDTAFAGLPSVQHNLSNGPVQDLAVAVYDLGPGRGLRIDFDAAPDVTDLATVAAHQDRLLRFLRTALDEPERPLGAIDLLSVEERRLVVEEWNATTVAIEDASLSELVERQAMLRPEHPA